MIIWDFSTGQEGLKIDLVNAYEYDVKLTQNYIVCESGRYDGYAEFRIHKKSKIKTDFFPKGEISCFTSEDYLIFVNQKKGQIKVFQDRPDDLALLHSLEVFNPPDRGRHNKFSFGYVQIYQDWLLVSKDGLLRLWSLKTGTLLTTIQYNEKKFEYGFVFLTNGNALLTCGVLGDSHSLQEYVYALHDFASKNGSPIVPSALDKPWFKII